MQTPTPHPSRSAPKCVDCRHYRPELSLCDHPAAQVDLVKGYPHERALYMRRAEIDKAAIAGLVVCGPAGSLFDAIERIDDVVDQGSSDGANRRSLNVGPD